MTILHVACAADERYVPHSAAMLHSVLVNRGECDVRLHYLHGPTLPRRLRAKLEQIVVRDGGAIEFHEIADERVVGLPEMAEVTTPMWYRIYLPELLPGVERVLYLDIDTLVLDSLAPLLEIDLLGHHLAAVSNVWEPWNRGRPRGLGLPDAQAYFNSGVLLMNLELMRAEGSTAALHDYATTHRSQLWWPDQDAFNVVLGADRVSLHPRWNCMNSVLTFPHSPAAFGSRAVAEARRHPAIRHFEGPGRNKPWHRGCDQQLRDLYFRHRRETPWPRVELVGEEPRRPRWRRTGQPVSA
jgi:lipopolysaccharide biosynthesis glycosyltransferase